MKRTLIFSIFVIIIFISNAFCLSDEKKEHICFRSVDADQNGMLTFQEFVKMFGDDKVKFDKVDLNDDGKLSHEEYHQALGHGSL